MVTRVKDDLCTGCGVCAAVCPQKCLVIEPDKDGFYKARCREDECVNCGICDEVCPKFISIDDNTAINYSSAVSNDEKTLKTTSSGGLCYEISRRALAQGKKVCACVYDYEDHRAKHVVVTDLADLEATKGSKYFQSYSADAFAEIFDGSEWVVIGTPCQIAAIDAATRRKKIRDKFLLIDFFCHGTPSLNLWKKYVKENGGDKIQKIDFRSKEFGWHSFSFRFTYEDGAEASDFKDNMFYNFFFNNTCLGEACYSCHFKALKSAADIRVGDYWGDKYRGNDKGVSCCVTFSEVGDRALNDLSNVCLIRQEDESQMLKEQMVQSPSKPKIRKRVLRALRGKRSLKMINNTTMFAYRAKWKIKSIIGRS